MKLRKFTVTILIALMVAVPIMGQLSFNVYADSPTATREQVKEAFKAYCISRNVLVNGSVLGSAATWLGGTMDNIIDTLGIDMDYLQSQISVEVGGNLGVRYILNTSAVPLFNRIFAELLQREDLEVGDTDVNKVVFSGKQFTDLLGNSCFCFIYNGNGYALSGTDAQFNANIGAIGTPYLYPFEYIQAHYNTSFSHDLYPNLGINRTYNFGYGFQDDGKICNLNYSNDGNVSRTINWDIPQTSRYYVFNAIGYPCIVYRTASDSYHCGVYRKYNNLSFTVLEFSTEALPLSGDDTDVNITTPPDKSILPAPPDDEPITIDPNGNTGDEPDNPDNPDDPDNPIIPPDNPDDPTGGTPPDWGTDTEIEPDGDGWKIPFTLPDLDIDWSIDGLGSKFPFCIPRDLVALVGVLNVEPVAPSFTGTVDLFIYEWDIDIDFEDFEPIGVIVRNGLFILFCVGLLIATRSIIRG